MFNSQTVTYPQKTHVVKFLLLRNPKLIMVNFGNFLSELRKEKGWTQQELAHLLFVSDKTVSKWENGDQLPDFEMMVLIANLFEISLDEIVAGKKINKKKLLDLMYLACFYFLFNFVFFILYIKEEQVEKSHFLLLSLHIVYLTICFIFILIILIKKKDNFLMSILLLHFIVLFLICDFLAIYI